MTTDIERSYHHLLQFPSLAPTSKACCWKRCIRRKINDGSLLRIESFKRPTSEGGVLNVHFDPSWGIVPRVVCSSKETCNIWKNRRNYLHGNENFDKSSKSCLQASNSRGLSKLQYLEAEPGSFLLNKAQKSSSTVYQSLNLQCVRGACLNVSSKRRIHVAMSEEDLCIPVATSENEMRTLRETLKIERKNCRKLHKDLEEERCASAAAATEAMIMIRRLQEEKSAALVESRHYRLASEEKEAYDQEAILILKEALLVMENEVLSLREHLEAYRGMFLKIKSSNKNQLKGLEEDEKLSLLEGFRSALCSSADFNETIDSEIKITDVTDEQALAGMTKQSHRPSEVIYQQGNHLEDVMWKNEAVNVETKDIYGAQSFDEVSLSILDRVARLEERFAQLGYSQVVEPGCCDCASDGLAKSVGEHAASSSFDQNVHTCNNGKLRKDPTAEDVHDQEHLKHWDLRRVTPNPVASKQEHHYRTLEKGDGSESLDLTKPRDSGCEPRFMDVRDTEIDGIYDVKEVQCDPNSCGMPFNMESRKSLSGSIGNLNDSVQGSTDKRAEEMESAAFKDEISCPFSTGCSDPVPVDSWPMNEGRLMYGKAMDSSAASEDMQNLKLRLQALEGERAFMKVALESLKKENMELKLLQDIAQQLRELKGDVWKPGWKRPGEHKPLAVSSFLKGVLPFSGMQSSVAPKPRRFLCPYQESPNNSSSCEEHGQAGLFSLLKYHEEEQKPIRVMRECKVNLSSMINVAHDCHS